MSDLFINTLNRTMYLHIINITIIHNLIVKKKEQIPYSSTALPKHLIGFNFRIINYLD